MESASAERQIEEDTEGSQLSQGFQRISLILRKIFQHCSNSELLQLSLVNKQWNYEARSVIKDRCTLIAAFGPEQPCTDVTNFASHVQQMNVVPFSGIRFYFDDYDQEEDHSFTRWTETLHSACDAIRNQLPVKHFGVLFHRYPEEYPHCPPFVLVKKILKDHCGVLESLSLSARFNYREFVRPNFPRLNFPRLKKFVLDGSPGRLGIDQTAFIKTVVSRAPNLEELHLDFPVTAKVYEALLEGSSAVLVVDDEMDPVFHEIPDGAFGSLRLRKMRLSYYNVKYYRHFSMDEFNRIVPVVLQTSRTTLQELSIHSVFAPSLMRYGIRLENVTKLTIRLLRQLEHEVPQHVVADVSTFWRILQHFDFTHMFPKLNEIEIENSHRISPREMSQFVDEANFDLREPSPDRAVHIKHLRFQYSRNHEPFLISMFPHIETLEIENCFEAPQFGLICQRWTHLKQLTVHDKGIRRQNWDSLFCGLFPEEIAQLREKDDEFLKAVNIVPVMPSITCLKELKTFNLSIDGYHNFNGQNNPSFIFSKVTALIAISRCPNLPVTLENNSTWENAWSHVKNYPSIVLIE